MNPTSSESESGGVGPQTFRMSKTAGAALGEYSEVSPLAVTSLVLGVAGGLVVLGPVLAVVPLVGLVLGVWALVKISRSAGTQTGKLLALAGVVLCAGSVGFAGYQQWSGDHRIARERQAIDQLLGEFAKYISQSRYDQAYELLDPRQQSRITLERFKQTLEQLQNTPDYGRIVAATSGRQIELTVDPSTKNSVAQGLIILKLDASKFGANDDRGARERAVYWMIDGKWRIHDIPSWFPTRPGGQDQ